jgi:copper homeostasis protein
VCVVTLLEICLDDVAGAAVAEQHGADRIELCADLAQGGTTPSIGTVAAVLGSLSSVGVQVLIRQRPGDFVHSRPEVDAMVGDIEWIRGLRRPEGVPVGFVIGALTADGAVDVPVLRRLLRACGPAPVTFHRAFDAVADQREALETLIDLGLHRVLTSGGALSAAAGIHRLTALVEQAGDRIAVLAAGGIRAHNVAELVARTGVPEVHLRAQPSAPTTSSPPATSGEIVCAVARALAPG